MGPKQVEYPGSESPSDPKTKDLSPFGSITKSTGAAVPLPWLCWPRLVPLKALLGRDIIPKTIQVVQPLALDDPTRIVLIRSPCLYPLQSNLAMSLLI